MVGLKCFENIAIDIALSLLQIFNGIGQLLMGVSTQLHSFSIKRGVHSGVNVLSIVDCNLNRQNWELNSFSDSTYFNEIVYSVHQLRLVRNGFELGESLAKLSLQIWFNLNNGTNWEYS